MSIIKIGSRKSQLAIKQTEAVIKKLKEHFPNDTFEIVGISTKGDRQLDKSLQKAGRTFEMVGVSANGATKVYPDLDQDDSTITIACQNFYAFAVAYKDKKVK